ncbi:MAG: DUF1493 family protein [Pantoea sp.]|uniref:DUF1493 family protein n=1 Tax=Pantoea sp. TaxID=69393 RepID=UPI0039E3E69B
MTNTPQPCTLAAVIALIEYHNKPTALGWFKKVDHPNFYLQQLPLNEFEFADLMNDFFITFAVSSKHYDDARYFPATRLQFPLFARRKGLSYHPLTVALLCKAARLGHWPEVVTE